MPIWKRNPPCKAQTILTNMFINNQIPPDASPASIQKLHDEFEPFSSSVFRGAFNETRNKYGTEFAVKRTSSAAGFADSDSCAGGSGSTDCRPKRFKPDPELTCDDEDELDAKIAHKNQPVLMTVYRDPVTEQEKVCIVVSLPGGASDVEFSLVGSGPGRSTARITYSWPKILFDIEAIFKKAITSSELPVCHPKIIALKNELKNNRDSIDSTPKGSMELTLPINLVSAREVT
ncbi:uncharacterized protein LOC123469870 [Daphnia magna]|uniref:uncharacterized protein LOC123469870 n=1 Tax=Daphnia magna TaxID=35525 RepID=UPI001E1BA574|nr:uncharacterized protein LOC123469870 [Daphnia magna]